MPLARIITDIREEALPLANRLEAHGYAVEIVGRGAESRGAAELEIELDKMDPHQALARAARLSQGKQVNVFVGPGCLEAAPEPEPESVAEQLLDIAQVQNFTEPEAVEVPVQAFTLRVQEEGERASEPSQREKKSAAAWISKFQTAIRAIGREAARQSREVMARLGPVVKKVQLGIAAGFETAKRKSAAQSTQVKQRWNVYRNARTVTSESREQAKIEQLRRGELERARHLLAQQEEKRREIIHKRMAEEERAKQRLIEEQLRRVRAAEAEERRQGEREAQLERQRLEALRLAEERERVARERVERERLAEEARRARAEEAERRRREREEEILLQRREAQKAAQRPHVLPAPAQPPSPESQPAEAPVNGASAPVEPVPAYASAAADRESHFESDLNSPYHPGWTWAAAAAGAATVGIMLLWTAVSASRSTVHFAPLSPSSLLPSRAAGIQQQVPFGPVKVVVHKTAVVPVSVVPAATPVIVPPTRGAVAAPLTAPVPASPKQAMSAAKPSAAKAQMASSAPADTADNGPEVVVRHFTPPPKARVPQAGQTATVKRYSDMN